MYKFSCILILLIGFSFSLKAQEEKKDPFVNIFVEIPFSVTQTGVIVPRLMIINENIINAESGKGREIGIGISTLSKRDFEFRGGIRFWNHPLIAEIDLGGTNYAVEIAELKYLGPYFRFNYGTKYFFVGGGFDFSLKNWFSGSREYYDSNTLISTYSDISTSLLTKKFYNTFDLAVNIGGKIPLIHTLKLKPFIEVSIPITPLYERKEYTNLLSSSTLTIDYKKPVKAGLYYSGITKFGIALEF